MQFTKIQFSPKVEFLNRPKYFSEIKDILCYFSLDQRPVQKKDQHPVPLKFAVDKIPGLK